MIFSLAGMRRLSAPNGSVRAEVRPHILSGFSKEHAVSAIFYHDGDLANVIATPNIDRSVAAHSPPQRSESAGQTLGAS